jgi:2',3'-cyclic-nucleotide 2'-phosphodiesterase (5'-nucleotidase family)
MGLIRQLRICLLAAAVTLSFIGTAFAAGGTLTIFSTSDVHGSILGWDYFRAQPAEVGLAKISTIVNAERAKNPAVLLIDAGDYLQGTPLDTYMVNVDKDWKVHPMFAAFNQMKYDAIVLGNHEFNFGTDFLKKAIGTNKNVLSANTLSSTTGRTWDAVRPYVIRKVMIGGETVRVGIIGLTTPAIPDFEAPKHYAGLRFADQPATASQLVQELKGRVDLIVIATHSGVESDVRSSAENQVIGIAKACPEANLLIAAHNHVVIDNATGIRLPDGTFYKDAVVNGVPVVESGKDGKFVARSDLQLEKQTDGKWKVLSVRTQAVPVKGVAEDPAIVKQVEPLHKKTLAYLQSEIGKSTGSFPGEESNHRDSAIVDFVNDVQRYYAGTELSAAAAFNTKADIAPGAITRQEIAGLYIYENYLYGIEITGAELRKYLEFAAAHYGKAPDYNYDMLQGVDYTIDLSQSPGSQITRLLYQGKEVKDADVFTMAINDYRMNGGGGYMAAMGYTDGRKPKVVFDSMKAYGDAGQVRSLLERYITEKGTITPKVDGNWNVAGQPQE